jgi:hypothetical protein
MINGMKQLEALAVDAHHRGETWAAFWQQHAERVRNAEPFSREQYRRLVNRLLHLVTSGDSAGQYPPGDDPEPWLIDDKPSPHDTITQARLQPIPQVPQ